LDYFCITLVKSLRQFSEKAAALQSATFSFTGKFKFAEKLVKHFQTAG